MRGREGGNEGRGRVPPFLPPQCVGRMLGGRCARPDAGESMSVAPVCTITLLLLSLLSSSLLLSVLVFLVLVFIRVIVLVVLVLVVLALVVVVLVDALTESMIIFLVFLLLIHRGNTCKGRLIF